jgi:uncharacterized protein YvpB
VNSREPGRRRYPPLVVWFALGVFAVVVVATAGLGLLAWQEAGQLRALQAGLVELHAEHKAVQDQLLAMQDSVAAMEDRLASLEASDPAQQLARLEAALEAASDADQLNDLEDSLSGVQRTVSGFQSTLDSLSARMHALEGENNLPPEVRLSVGRQRQNHNLSCESSAVSMAANYHGLDLTEADVLAALPLDDNPHLGFRGDVDGPTGGIEDYGVYAGPVLEVLSDQGLRAWATEGGLAGIQAALARGNPVIAWVTYDCQPSTPVTVAIRDQEVTLVPWQHVVVVTGYNHEGVWANDPLDGKEDFYANADFERAMGYFGDMAIEVAAP